MFSVDLTQPVSRCRHNSLITFPYIEVFVCYRLYSIVMTKTNCAITRLEWHGHWSSQNLVSLYAMPQISFGDNTMLSQKTRLGLLHICGHIIFIRPGKWQNLQMYSILIEANDINRANLQCSFINGKCYTPLMTVFQKYRSFADKNACMQVSGWINQLYRYSIWMGY